MDRLAAQQPQTALGTDANAERAARGRAAAKKAEPAALSPNAKGRKKQVCVFVARFASFSAPARRSASGLCLLPLPPHLCLLPLPPQVGATSQFDRDRMDALGRQMRGDPMDCG
jgi:hypothetical protein